MLLRLLATTLALATAALPARAPAAGDLHFLRVEGGRLVDDLGREVVLRGINHIGLRSDRLHPLDPHAPHEDLFELDDLQDEDFATIASLGFNSVRLVVTWEFAQPDPPPAAYNEDYFARIDDAIAKANRHGMSVIFDFGQFGWSRSIGGNAGAPAWTVSPTCASMPRASGGAPPQASGPVGCMFYNFWMNSNGLQDRYIDLWRFVAARYKDDAGVAMYDLFNEPSHGPLPPGVYESQYLYPFYRRLAAAIREIDPRHPVMIQPDVTRSIGVPRPFTEPLGIPNALYGPHNYSVSYARQRVHPRYDSTQGTDAAIVRADFEQNAREAAGLGVPWVVGETGWTRSTHADGVGGPVPLRDDAGTWGFARELVQLANDMRIGWTWFAYAQNDLAYGVNWGGDLDAQLADILARPFPRATGGRVGAIDDATGYLFTYDPAPPFVDAPTEISIPARAYPCGATVLLGREQVARFRVAGSPQLAPGVGWDGRTLSIPDARARISIVAGDCS